MRQHLQEQLFLKTEFDLKKDGNLNGERLASGGNFILLGNRPVGVDVFVNSSFNRETAIKIDEALRGFSINEKSELNLSNNVSQNLQLQYENFYIWTEGQQSQDDNSKLVIFTSGAGQTITPFIGNKSDAQGALEAVTKIINPLNEINENFKNFLGSGLSMNILQDLNSKLTSLAIGNVFYCLANENQYLLVNNIGLTENSTLQDAIDTNSVKNMTPQKFGSVWVNFSTNKSFNTNAKYKNNTNYNIYVIFSSQTTSSSGAFTQIKIDNAIVVNMVSVNYTQAFASVIVPPNSEIEIIHSGATFNANYYWAELLDSPSSQGLELIN